MDDGGVRVLDTRTGATRLDRPGWHHVVHVAPDGPALALQESSPPHDRIRFVHLKEEKADGVLPIQDGHCLAGLLADGSILVEDTRKLALSRRERMTGRVLWEHPTYLGMLVTTSRDGRWMSAVGPAATAGKILETSDVARSSLTRRFRPMMTTYFQ